MCPGSAIHMRSHDITRYSRKHPATRSQRRSRREEARLHAGFIAIYRLSRREAEVCRRQRRAEHRRERAVTRRDLAVYRRPVPIA